MLRVKAISSKTAFCYCVLTLFMLAFVNFEGAVDLDAPLRVPYISGKVVIWHCLMSVFFFIIILLIKYKVIAHIDIPAACLLVKCFLDLLPIVAGLSDISDYFAHWACTLVSFISYFIIIKSDLNQYQVDIIKLAVLCFGVVLSIQVIHTFLQIEVPYYSFSYKGEMLIPYGATNIIASAIVPIICICYYSKIKSVFKLWIILIMLLAVVLTKSRGGMLLSLMTLLLLLYIRVGSSKNVFIRRFMLIALVVVGIIVLLNNEIVRMVLMGFAADESSVDANTVSSGRIEIWRELLLEVSHTNIITGVGMKSLAANESGAHNIIIDLIYKCGIIGTINYIILLWYIIKRGLREYKANNRGLFMAVIVMLFNMMYEVNYFTYSCDCMFWIITGLMMKEYYIKRSMIGNNYARSSYANPISC